MLLALPLLPSFVGASAEACDAAADRSAAADPDSLTSSEGTAESACIYSCSVK